MERSEIRGGSRGIAISGLRCAPSGLRLHCQPPQAVPAHAVAAIDRHRQPHGLFGAPARARRVAGEFSSAAGTGEAARAPSF